MKSKQKSHLFQLSKKQVSSQQSLKCLRDPLTKLGKTEFDLLSFPEGKT